jgi:hypothetical protein
MISYQKNENKLMSSHYLLTIMAKFTKNNKKSSWIGRIIFMLSQLQRGVLVSGGRVNEGD